MSSEIMTMPDNIRLGKGFKPQPVKGVGTGWSVQRMLKKTTAFKTGISLGRTLTMITANMECCQKQRLKPLHGLMNKL